MRTFGAKTGGSARAHPLRATLTVSRALAALRVRTRATCATPALSKGLRALLIGASHAVDEAVLAFQEKLRAIGREGRDRMHARLHVCMHAQLYVVLWHARLRRRVPNQWRARHLVAAEIWTRTARLLLSRLTRQLCVAVLPRQLAAQLCRLWAFGSRVSQPAEFHPVVAPAE
eukprot:813087-Pleurochrysis_carterae.AAC.1